MQIYDIAFQDSFVLPLLDNGSSKVLQFSFQKDKELKKHKTTSDILVLVTEGQIVFSAAEDVLIKKGQMISLPKNIEHSIRALEESILLVILTPSPTMQPVSKPQGKQVGSTENKAVAPQLLSFVEEHAELLQLLDQTRGEFELGTYKQADRMIFEELDRHFRYEEDYLFPLLGKYIGTQSEPIAVMVAEHTMIRNNHEMFRKRLGEYIEGKCSQADLEQTFSPLEGVLRAHILKEDHVLFPMASEVMSEEDKDEVAKQVESQKSKHL